MNYSLWIILFIFLCIFSWLHWDARRLLRQAKILNDISESQLNEARKQWGSALSALLEAKEIAQEAEKKCADPAP